MIKTSAYDPHMDEQDLARELLSGETVEEFFVTLREYEKRLKWVATKYRIVSRTEDLGPDEKDIVTVLHDVQKKLSALMHSFYKAEDLYIKETEGREATVITQQYPHRKKEAKKMIRKRGRRRRVIAETFRNFNLDMIPYIVHEALKEIKANPQDFVTFDDSFEYFAETILSATGRSEDYADALDIDTDSSDWQEGLYDMVQEAEDEVNDKFQEVMQRNDLPGYLVLSSHEDSGDYGLIYGIDYDDAELEGIVIPR